MSEIEGQDEGGNASLDGWFYQCDVSVLAALELMVVNRAAKVLQLEPASQEDLEAQLEAPRAMSSAQVKGVRLIVQAKLRRSGQWTDASLHKLMKHGKQRPSALELLNDERVRYVLVTSADVSGAAAFLQIDEIAEQPPAGDLPSEVFPDTHLQAAAGRVAFLAQYNEKRVAERIDTQLLSPLCVPRPNLVACREELRKVAMAGMRNGYAWPQAEVEAIVKAHGGSIPWERNVQFVPPQNWTDIVAQVDEHHAIVITGPSGTGKTTAAEALFKHYQRIVPGLTYLEPESIGQLNARPGNGPSFSYVQDPWGKYEIKEGTGSWTMSLVERLLKAGPQHKIVVTTRTDILLATAGKDSKLLKRWEVGLDATRYGKKELGKMFELRVRDLGSATLKLAAIAEKEKVLRVLQTPFEIDRFVSLLQTGVAPTDENVSQFVSRILSDTQTTAIEREVELVVTGRHLEKAAAIVWGLMAARGGLTRLDMPTLRRALNRLDPTFKDSLATLVNALVAGGNLRQSGSEVTYTHPRVEKGLLEVMKANPAVTEEALDHLSTALVSMSKTSGRHAIEAVVQMYAIVKNRDEPLFEASDDVQRAIDTWLEEKLVQDDEDYVGLLRVAAIVGSRASIPAEVARWFKPVPTGGHFFMRGWTSGNRSSDWFANVFAHRATRPICERFIRLALTAETRDYPINMAVFIDKLATGLDSAWAEAARKVVSHGEDPNATAVAFGAMRARENREPLLQLALVDLRKSADAKEEEADYWPYVDEHYNADTQPDGDYSYEGFAASELVSAYAEATRRDLGWQELAAHPDVQDLATGWFDEMARQASCDVSDEELRTLLAVDAGGYLEQRTWRLLAESWRPAFEGALRQRLLDGSDDLNIRQTAARCALAQVPLLLAEVAQSLLEEGRRIRLLELTHDAKEHTAAFGTRSGQDEAYGAFESSLPASFSELARALTPIGELQETQLSPQALDVLVPMLGQHKGPLRVLLIWLAAVNRRADETVLQAALGESVRKEEAEVVVRAAAIAGNWTVVRAALSHPRAKARERALDFLTPSAHAAIPDELLAFVGDPSSGVRLAVLKLLATKPENYASQLVQLCEDTWAKHSAPQGEFQNYPIARGAAQALSGLASVPPELTVPIVEAALQTDDLKVAGLLFSLLVERGDEDAVQEVINQVFTLKPNWNSVEAAEALTRTRRKLKDGSLARATAKWLGKSHRYLAATTTQAVGNGAASAQVMATAKALASMVERRVLLLMLAIGAERQSEELAMHVLDMLPPGHVARQILDASARPLPHDALDNLGEIRIVNAVHELIGMRIDPRPSLVKQKS